MNGAHVADGPLHLRSKLAQDFWDLIAHFFAARRQFQETYDNYETLVLHYAEEYGLDRRLLRLSAEQVSGLLDFRKLEKLRDGDLFALKTVSHNIFRNDKGTDPFDRAVSQIFHELSILKEEQYRISMIAPEVKKDADETEYQAIIDEVHNLFPRYVHGIQDLFVKAQGRLEELLPRFVQGPQGKVTIRSLYLFGEESLAGFYPNGLEDLYDVIYPGGAVEGFLTVARSFAESGFREYAIEALEKSVRVISYDLYEPSFASTETARGAEGGSSLPLGVSVTGAPRGPDPLRAQERRREAESFLRDLKDAPKKKAPTPMPAARVVV